MPKKKPNHDPNKGKGLGRTMPRRRRPSLQERKANDAKLMQPGPDPETDAINRYLRNIPRGRSLMVSPNDE